MDDMDLEVSVGDNYLNGIEEYDLIIKAPGISFKGMDISKFEMKITSQLELFLEYIPSNTIGITGTKGKSTTSSLMYEVLKNNGKKAFLLGNIGNPIFDSIEEIDGLGLVYDYIRSDDWIKCSNIYIIFLINLKLFSLTPYPEAGGKLRNADCYLPNSGVNTCPYNQIDKEIAKLYFEFDELLKRGIGLGNNSTFNNEDNLINYINDCLKLKCKLIQIHPFQDGNGRTMRALVNLLFKLAGIPPIYVKYAERNKYLEGMNKAIIDGNFDYIDKFYYYKICDSILTLDVNKRIKKDIKLKRLINAGRFKDENKEC